MCHKSLILKYIGGEGGIRTLGTLASSTVFETAPFDHSGTSPQFIAGFFECLEGENQQKVTFLSLLSGGLLSERLPNAAMRAVSTFIAASLYPLKRAYRLLYTGSHG